MSEKESTEMRVCAFMTLPRYENVLCRNTIQAALLQLGIPLHTAQGVFYGQCMQRLFASAIDVGIEIALTIDFDSMFTGEHIMALLRTLAMRPDIDAVAAIQARRGGQFPLMTIKGQTQLDWDGKPVQVSTAHFGLTAIRLNKVARMPKPWFHSVPGEGGNWEDESGKVDDDIYFWHRWKEAGNTIYVDPAVRIGHMEEMVAIYNDQYEVEHVYPKVWREKQNKASDTDVNKDETTD